MYEDIFKKIEDNDVITIFGHTNPDGDCYGSTQGLKTALQEFYPNKKIYVSSTNFYRIPFSYPYADEIDDETIKNSLAIICDLSNKARIGDARAFTAKDLIKIDHHIFTEEFGGLEYVDDSRASCSDYIADILYSKFKHLPKLAASLFYLGITTDSGRFLYSPNAQLLSTASKLIKDGADVNYIYDTLYVTDEKSLKFKSYLWSAYKTTTLGVAYLVLSNKILQKCGYTKNEAAGFTNSIAKIEASKMHVLFIEGDDGKVRVELRSSGKIDVQKIACKFNGGGHLNASGCVLEHLSDYKKVIKECEKTMYKSFSPYGRELKTMLNLVSFASKTIMTYYRDGFDVEIKDDNSPVTSADKAADVLIRDTLVKKYPSYGLLTEEDYDSKERLDKDYVFILDPLDGTKDFVAKDDMFAVNLALVYKHEPVIGVVGIPAQDKIYFAVKGKGSFVIEKGKMIRQIHVSSKTSSLTAFESCFHSVQGLIDLIEANSKITNHYKVGSALKACLIAEGKGELCYTIGSGTKEWDTCAPQLVVEEAGGIYYSTKKEKITYNREDVYNRDGFIIANRVENDVLDLTGVIKNEK